jgi:nitrite reductase/ring-hydroxylating ferredoxin subunit
MAAGSAETYRLCALADLPGEGSKGFKLADRTLFAVNYQGSLYLYHNACPHIGTRLEWVEDQFLDSSGTLIQCANHGALFVIQTGKCVAGPCEGRSLTPVDYQIEGDNIFIHKS